MELCISDAHCVWIRGVTALTIDAAYALGDLDRSSIGDAKKEIKESIPRDRIEPSLVALGADAFLARTL